MMRAREAVNVVAREFFQVALVTYLLLTLAETLKTGFVSNFFNLNELLIIVLVTGVAMVLTDEAGESGEASAEPVSAPEVLRSGVRRAQVVRRRVVRRIMR